MKADVHRKYEEINQYKTLKAFRLDVARLLRLIRCVLRAYRFSRSVIFSLAQNITLNYLTLAGC